MRSWTGPWRSKPQGPGMPVKSHFTLTYTNRADVQDCLALKENVAASLLRNTLRFALSFRADHVFKICATIKCRFDVRLLRAIRQGRVESGFTPTERVCSLWFGTHTEHSSTLSSWKPFIRSFEEKKVQHLSWFSTNRESNHHHPPHMHIVRGLWSLKLGILCIRMYRIDLDHPRWKIPLQLKSSHEAFSFQPQTCINILCLQLHRALHCSIAAGIVSKLSTVEVKKKKEQQGFRSVCVHNCVLEKLSARDGLHVLSLHLFQPAHWAMCLAL